VRLESQVILDPQGGLAILAIQDQRVIQDLLETLEIQVRLAILDRQDEQAQRVGLETQVLPEIQVTLATQVLLAIQETQVLLEIQETQVLLDRRGIPVRRESQATQDQQEIQETQVLLEILGILDPQEIQVTLATQVLLDGPVIQDRQDRQDEQAQRVGLDGQVTQVPQAILVTQARQGIRETQAQQGIQVILDLRVGRVQRDLLLP
jgi:hypothetical protein